MQCNDECIVEGIMMKMRSPKLYEHLRKEDIMVLPGRTCLQRYVQRFEGGFGLSANIFNALTEKTMDVYSRHGHIEGFVDLGDHTPADQKNVVADHGMVVLFQPLTGNWTQILGVFASKSNVKSATLAKIIVETTMLAEKAGLFVDCITCDGASWNRSMWRLFGIQGSSSHVRSSTKHPVVPKRQLFFVSDFPHLLKNDKLENLFAIIRQSSGCNDHPTVSQFLVTVNLLAFYNLAKPPRGGNCPRDVIKALLSPNELSTTKNLVDRIDGLLDRGSINDAEDVIQSLLSSDHQSYTEKKSNSALIYYVAGYVARNIISKNSCPQCAGCLCVSKAENECRFRPEFFQRVAASGRTTVSVRGCVTRVGLGPLVRIEGALTADKYSDILYTVGLPPITSHITPQHDWIFQHDRSPVHTARKVDRLL
ncbi:hypothetical protein HPB50_012603 [Hyalomma asiaticum]|uniref:Uncharacterized protein n=1 Tax=Hyalomma asiaticum TaxID=266040 RepID=A0ACB7TH59_HYAAI|nr:hypothetical protein HPB50_012603 [Hyalomma asiaticum]